LKSILGVIIPQELYKQNYVEGGFFNIITTYICGKPQTHHSDMKRTPGTTTINADH